MNNLIIYAYFVRQSFTVFERVLLLETEYLFASSHGGCMGTTRSYVHAHVIELRSKDGSYEEDESGFRVIS